MGALAKSYNKFAFKNLKSSTEFFNLDNANRCSILLQITSCYFWKFYKNGLQKGYLSSSFIFVSCTCWHFFLLLSFCNRRIYFLYLKPTEITLLTKHSKLGIFLAFFLWFGKQTDSFLEASQYITGNTSLQ